MADRTEENHFKQLVTACGQHLFTSLHEKNYTAIASFSLAAQDYLRNGGSQFTTVLTVHIMRYITERTELPSQRCMKIVAQVYQKEQTVFINFRWLTKKAKAELKSKNPNVVELCWVCKLNKPARDFKRCGNCRDASYCSVECQRKSWPDHRKECNKERVD